MAPSLIQRFPSLPVLIWALAFAFITIQTGCSKPVVVDGYLPVVINGQTFQLEVVADNDTRTLGLGSRTHMDEDKGMLFSFPDSKIRHFVMRDCFIDIDIIFLDKAGRITAMHHMPIEEPKLDTESNDTYERRLKRYSSRFNAQYAIELVGGKLESLNLEEGQQIDFDVEYLQSITQ